MMPSSLAAPKDMRLFLLLAVVTAVLSSCGCCCFAFTTNPQRSLLSSRRQSTSFLAPIFSSSPSSSSSSNAAAAAAASTPPPISDDIEFVRYPDKPASDQWELDCYSRPVVVPGGKKLWEILVTDSTGSFRLVKTLPSNQVNSKQVRATMEQFLEDFVDQHNLEIPSTIRFFRGAMFNMINIALGELEVVAKPSRCTFALAQWLEERHKHVYPQMEGYVRGEKKKIIYISGNGLIPY
jgi:hypothetical protein